MKKGYVYTDEQREQRRAQMLAYWATVPKDQRRAKLAHFIRPKKYASAAEKSRACRSRLKAKWAALMEKLKRLEECLMIDKHG